MEAADIIGRAMGGDKGAIQLLRDFGVPLRADATWTEILTATQRHFAGALEASNMPLARNTQKIKDLAAGIGEKLIPIMTPLLESFGKFFDWLNKLIVEHPKLFAAMSKIAVPAALIILGLGSIGLAVATLMTGLGGLATMFRVTLPVAMSFLTAHPVVAMIIALAALGIIIFQFRDDFVEAFKAMKDAVEDFIGALKRIPTLPHIPGLPKIPFPPSIIPGGFPFGKGAVPTTVPTSGPTVLPWTRQLQEAAWRAGEIPGFQHGGIVTRPTVLLAGERGPEAIVPLSRGGGGLGSGIHVHFHGPVYGMADFRAKILETVRNAATRGGLSHVIG